MPKVQIKDYKVHVGAKKISLLSGEMHYWRLNPDNWKQCLNQIREMGLNIVSTYVPWDYHEVKRGDFDFTGKTSPTRDLVKFLKLTQKEKFWVIIRPGPYIYSEWPNDGVPDYAYKYHRLHPTFLKYAENYLKKVCKVIKPFQATQKGGNIILLQADNEIDPWPDVFGHQYGAGKKPGLFRDFMKKKYRGSIRSLNKVWGTDYKNFSDVGWHEIIELPGDEFVKRNLDTLEFKHDYSLKVAKWAVKAYQKLGIDVPIYLNAYPFFYAHDWEQLQSVSDLVGIDLYPENEFKSAREDHRKTLDKVRYLRTFASIPYIAEFASGVWHNHHYETGVLSPNHYRLLSVSCILAGIQGWNWYMLVNRDNWYMAPINEWGRKRPELFPVFKGIIDVFKKMDPPSCQKVVNATVVFNTSQYATQTTRREEAVLDGLYGADIDYDFFDTKTGKIGKKVLFYTGNPWLRQSEHENILDYIKRGGCFVAFRTYPRKDENFNRFNILGLQDPDRVLFKFKKDIKIPLNSKVKIETTSSLWTFNKVKGQAIRVPLKDWGNQTIGYLRQVGKGKILHLGVDPQPEVLRGILKFLNVEVPTTSPTRGIQTALFKRENKYFLTVTNNSDVDRTALIEINHRSLKNKKLSVKNLFTGKSKEIKASQEPHLVWSIPRKDASIFEISL